MGHFGMGHREEYKRDKTIGAWTEDEAMEEADWSIKLCFKDVHGKATLQEQVAIKLNSLLGYNNVDYVPQEEVMIRAQEILDLIESEKK
jgi:hypothetical protein